MVSNLSVNNENVNDVLDCFFDSPMKFYKVIQKLMFFINMQDVALHDEDIYYLEKLREILIEVDHHNKKEAFEDILKALKTEESEKEKSNPEDLTGRMVRFAQRIERGELNIQK
jgi:hypothetical protein